jgi:hypothetical protein
MPSCIPAMAGDRWGGDSILRPMVRAARPCNSKTCGRAHRLPSRAAGEEPIHLTEMGARVGEAVLPPRATTPCLHEPGHQARRTAVFCSRGRAGGMMRPDGEDPRIGAPPLRQMIGAKRCRQRTPPPSETKGVQRKGESESPVVRASASLTG